MLRILAWVNSVAPLKKRLVNSRIIPKTRMIGPVILYIPSHSLLNVLPRNAIITPAIITIIDAI
jgi:hypothetical protein